MSDSLAVEMLSDVIERFIATRKQTEELVSPLSEADAQLQSMPDASPAKWHFAHTTWFFETFILCEYRSDFRRFEESYNYLFNSYYNGIGDQYARHQRGLISRPSLKEVMEYRRVTTAAILDLAEANTDNQALLDLIELGIQHEQQHQELLLTDIKHAFFHNPSFPVYQSLPTSISSIAASNSSAAWLQLEGGLVDIGYDQHDFSFDNERPAHQVYIHPFQLRTNLVSNGEYLEFVASGAYQNPEFWLADGWAWLQANRASGQGISEHPLYWLNKEGEWFEYTLHGLLPLNLQQPLVHVSYYEASAYAAWAGSRLPTEFEWEAAIKHYQVNPKPLAISVHPQSNVPAQDELQQAFGHAWQWTVSGYGPYPGFTPFAGVAGEYNGKFMSNQNVLRGSSCVTPSGHARLTYRNFFYANQSWQFSGIRLAKNVE